MNSTKPIQLGLYENNQQFAFVLITTLFIGSMIGLERTVLPLLGEEHFGLASATAALSFIVSFGFSKAIVNLFAGKLADTYSRKKVLILGWLFGIPVPLLVIWADAWWLIILANIFLGINQGLTWSLTVNISIDLAKPTQRAMAVGFNEFIGYLGVGLATIASGYLASVYSLRPEPFYLGLGFVTLGIIFSIIIEDTGGHLNIHKSIPGISVKNTVEKEENIPGLKEAFFITSWHNKELTTVSQAGLITMLKDGMAWGLFPLYLASTGLSLEKVGIVVALYPASWGFFQLFTGPLSDKTGRKWMIAGGMWFQAAGIIWILVTNTYPLWILGSIVIGLGTAMVHPTLPAVVSDVVPASWRASSMGVFRLWRDSGYAFGAIVAGLLTDLLNINWAIGLVAALPIISGLIVAIRLKETNVMARTSKNELIKERTPE